MSRAGEFHSSHREYRGLHQPDVGEAAVGVHEADRLYPDVYAHPEYYGSGEPAHDRETMAAVRRARGNPDAMITIHRAVPHGVQEINPGDWVTTSKAYARAHGRHATDPKQDLPVVSRRVPAREVVEGSGNSIHEWGWRPGP